MIKKAYYTCSDCAIHLQLDDQSIVTKNYGRLSVKTRYALLLDGNINSDFKCSRKIVRLLNNEFYPSELRVVINKIFTWIKK